MLAVREATRNSRSRNPDRKLRIEDIKAAFAGAALEKDYRALVEALGESTLAATMTQRWLDLTIRDLLADETGSDRAGAGAARGGVRPARQPITISRVGVIVPDGPIRAGDDERTVIATAPAAGGWFPQRGAPTTSGAGGGVVDERVLEQGMIPDAGDRPQVSRSVANMKPLLGCGDSTATRSPAGTGPEWSGI